MLKKLFLIILVTLININAFGAFFIITTNELWGPATNDNPHAGDGVTVSGNGSSNTPKIWNIPDGFAISNNASLSFTTNIVYASIMGHHILNFSNSTYGLHINNGSSIDCNSGSRENFSEAAASNSLTFLMNNQSITGYGSLTNKSQTETTDFGVGHLFAPARLLITGNTYNVTLKNIYFAKKDSGAYVDNRGVNIYANGNINIDEIITKDINEGGSQGDNVKLFGSSITVSNIDTRCGRTVSPDPAGDIVLNALSGPSYTTTNFNNNITNTITINGNLNTTSALATAKSGGIYLQSVRTIFGRNFTTNFGTGATSVVVGKFKNESINITNMFQNNSTSGATLFNINYNVDWNSVLNTNLFSYKTKIRFKGYDKTETLTNFNALIQINPLLIGDFSYNQMVCTNGGDIRFMTSNFTESVNHEIEVWNTNGISYIWTQIPTISSSNDYIWMLWGSTTACSMVMNTNYVSTNGATWFPTYNLVMHFNKTNNSGNLLDSTAYKRLGTNSGLPSINVTNGIVDGAQYFDGTNSVIIGSIGSASNNARTIIGWVKDGFLPKANAGIFGYSPENATTRAHYLMAINATSNGHMNYVAGDDKLITSPLNSSTYNFYAASYLPNVTNRVYYNGILGQSTNFGGNLITGDRFVLGTNNGTTTGFRGTIDEVRVSTNTLSSNYVWAIYNNAASNTTFIEYLLGTVYTNQTRINNSSDDAEEYQNNLTVDLTSTDIELVYDVGNTNRGNQYVGLRFRNVDIPKTANIITSYIQFTDKETNVNLTACNLIISGEASDSSSTYANTVSNISSRTKTITTVNWQPAIWNITGDQSTNQRTPQLTGIINEIITRSGWQSGNSIAMIITGTGTRTAWSYDGSTASNALLYIEYTLPSILTSSTIYNWVIPKYGNKLQYPNILWPIQQR